MPTLTGEELWQRDYDATHPRFNVNATVIRHSADRYSVEINGMLHVTETLRGCLALLGWPSLKYYRVEEI